MGTQKSIALETPMVKTMEFATVILAVQCPALRLADGRWLAWRISLKADAKTYPELTLKSSRTSTGSKPGCRSENILLVRLLDRITARPWHHPNQETTTSAQPRVHRWLRWRQNELPTRSHL